MRTFSANGLSATNPKEYFRQYHLKNREKRNARNSAYGRLNPHVNKKSAKEYRARMLAIDPHFERARHVKSRYGITMEEYRALFAKENGKCHICLDRVSKHIDHCHKSGKVRGALCGGCNLMLGIAKDNPAVFTRAITYLTE